VSGIIDERGGEMIELKSDCVMLGVGVVAYLHDWPRLALPVPCRERRTGAQALPGARDALPPHDASGKAAFIPRPARSDGSLLGAFGVTLTHAQRLMRYSDPRLTQDV